MAQAYARRLNMLPWTSRWSQAKINVVMYGATFTIAGLGQYVAHRMGRRPKTETKEWQEASEDYARFQNMEPMGTGGRKAFTPSYMQPQTEREKERIRKYG